MKKLILTVFTFLIIIFMSHSQEPTNTKETTLFERLGGTEGIASIVDDVIEAHMNNPEIKARFLPYKEQPERMAVIRQHTIEFFSAGSGGPVQYTGKDMPDTHKGMNISAAEYMCVVDDIMMVLDNHKIDEESKKDVLAILWSLKGMIMNM
ncbi:group 1 truncated hemoglobin [Saccharicrinis sp. FJH62]|uniref:group I truncated hemoglobin n=1 Tax=Saccharicrinis sp. FJH62 TaxID=3344657 RepID=UPI0035D4A9EC